MFPCFGDLSALQRAAASSRDGPLLVIGVAGTGKTATLLARLGLALEREQGGAERAVLLASSEAAAQAIRAWLGPAAAGCEGAVLTLPALCERLLRICPGEAGLDPFFVTATKADRVALLMERIEELPLDRHDLQGRPATLMASIVARIDSLKADLVSSQRFAAWASGLDGEASEAEGGRELEFAQLYAEHDRMLAERATPDPGELVLRMCALLEQRPRMRSLIAERCRHLLIDDYEHASPAACTLVELLTSEHRRLTVAADARAGAVSSGVARLRANHPDVQVIVLARNFRSPAAIVRIAAVVRAGSDDSTTTPAPGEPTPAPGEATTPAPGEATTPAPGEATTPAPPGAPTTPAPGGATPAPGAPTPAPGAPVELWRAANARAQAQSVAVDIERLIAHGDVQPERIAVLLGSPAQDSQTIVGALEERAISHQLRGGAALFERAEVRDVLAWMRLLIDPRDAAAVVRVLARPPIELRQVDLARVVQIGRRRKLDMIAALTAAVESPQIPPEARERLRALLDLHRETAAELDTIRPDLFVHRLIERLGLRRQRLFAAQRDVVEGLLALARLGELAGAFVRRAPQSSARDLAQHLAAISEAGLPAGEGLIEPSPRGVQVMGIGCARGQEFEHVYVLGEADREHLYLAVTRAHGRLVLSYAASSAEEARRRPPELLERARQALGMAWIDREEDLFGPAEALHGTLRLMREELLADLGRVAGRLGELRLDTELDVAHGVVRYLELLKLAALLERPAGESIAQALAEINPRLLAATTSLEGEILQSSTLDDGLIALDAGRAAGAIRASGPGAGGDEPSLAPFLARRGDGLVLSASDVETYLHCPLRYKFARVFRIPTEPTLNQRFGIVVHQVLERYHSSGAQTLAQMTDLLEAGWRRSGLGDGEQERQLYRKARGSLARYHERLGEQEGKPVWFERAFSFALGPHQIRGRVDRVDQLPDAEGYELIDYKTGLPRSVHQLVHDIQLSLYALAAGEAWQLETAKQAYYYVLDDRKVALPAGAGQKEWIRETVLEVGGAISEQEFEPTPSPARCAQCDYRIICPAAES